jgi:hypothetical protein
VFPYEDVITLTTLHCTTVHACDERCMNDIDDDLINKFIDFL